MESKPFVFLVSKGCRAGKFDRGGIYWAIKAYVNEFKKGENVLLYLKVNGAYGLDNIDKVLQELVNPDSPPIYLDKSYYPYNKLGDIYRKGDVLVSPVRAEAYGLQHIEAMACGLPCIVSDFGGQTDFINNENGWLIGGELKEVKNELFYEKIKWLEPNISDLRRVMREAYENHQMLEKKSLQALNTARMHSWDVSAKIALNFIELSDK